MPVLGRTVGSYRFQGCSRARTARRLFKDYRDTDSRGYDENPFLLTIRQNPCLHPDDDSCFCPGSTIHPASTRPQFLVRPNEPYALTLTETGISFNASNTPQTHISQLKLYRDSVGRERTEAFYDNGRLATVTIRDPGRSSTTFLKVVDKSALVLYTPRPLPPPPGKGWTVERLQPRVVAGFPAEGLRFTRTIPAAIEGTVPSVTVTEEDWISHELGVVLEQTFDNPRIGKTTKTVTRLQKVEPDAALFIIPGEYSVQQSGPPSP
jgi:hypothetical protein